MFRQERLNIFSFNLYLATDIIFITLSFYLPYIFRWNFFGGDKVTPVFIQSSFQLGGLFFPSVEHYTKVYIFWGLITVFFLVNQNLYRTNRLVSFSQESVLIFKAVLYSTLVTGLVVFFIKAIQISRLVFVFNFILLWASLSTWRMIKRLILRMFILKGYNNFNVLLVGINKLSLEAIEEIKKYPFLGWRIIGFLDESKEVGSVISGLPVLGRYKDFGQVAHKYFIDETLIATPGDRKTIMQLVDEGRKLNVGIKVIPNSNELSLDLVDVYKIGYLPVLSYSIKTFHGTELFGKRIFDIIFSALALVLLFPFFIALGIAIKVNDGGPIFYISRRYGRKGTLFKFYKFRSMQVGADSLLVGLKNKNEKDGPIFKIKKDPRVNRIGRFMRKYSIDELPQLWNVLIGDMSLVGPRPLPIDQLQKDDFNQLKRLEIKPGITGLWQISGRSDVSFGNLVRWDIWYINNWSLWLDFNIILKSIPVVVKGKGAY